MKTVGFCTLGCKVNTYESAYLEEMFEKEGYTIQDYHLPCDVYVINTCTVTNESDIKSRKMIRFCRKQNPDAILVAMGCFIEAHPSSIEGVDIQIGNQSKKDVLKFIETYQRTHQKQQLSTVREKTVFEDMFLTSFHGRTRAFVKIQDGCENFCTYCIIPYVRGKCRSKKFETVLQEVKELVQKGYQEVVLTGIHTGHYGVDIDHTFSELLEAICQIKGLVRLRISSIEITELQDDFLRVLKENPIIVDHLHIPLQAGCDKILKRMGRKYDLDYFEKMLQKIRKIRPQMAITTDVIVGFPGETEEDFLETLDTVKRFQFMKVHVFPFSLREGTAAEKLDGHIDAHIKKQRVRRLLAVSEQLEEDFLKRFIGTDQAVLFETLKENVFIGHTSNYMKVETKDKVALHQIVMIHITGISKQHTLEGNVILEKCEV